MNGKRYISDKVCFKTLKNGLDMDRKNLLKYVFVW